jgi:hypothetical protein
MSMDTAFDDFFAVEFDVQTEEVETKPSYDPIPDGTVASAMLVEFERDLARAGYRKMKYKVQITEGPYQGRFVWGGLNLGHPDERPRQIAQRDLRQLLDALAPQRGGSIQVRDPSELLHLPLQVKVKLSVQEGYAPRNEVVKWMPAGDAPAASAAANPKQTKVTSTPPPAAAAPATEKKKMPWERR